MRINNLLRKLFIIVYLLGTIFWHLTQVKADELTNLSVSLGDSQPNNYTSYTINFNVATTSLLKKINFYFVKAHDNSNKTGQSWG